jgi:prevent-host-death family protein
VEKANVVEVKKNFSDFMTRVAYAGQRLIVERHGKPMMAWISIEDLKRLEQLEQGVNATREQRRLALLFAQQVREQIALERSGKTIEDSADTLNRLREKRINELTHMR